MAADIDQQFVEYVIKSLVSKPDAVKVDRSVDEKGVLLALTVDPEDLGRVIGKRGATAQSLRTLLRALGTKNEARYNLKIIDNGSPKPGASQPSASNHSSSSSSDDDQPDESVETKTTSETKVETEIATPALEEESEAAPAEDDVLSRTRKELADLDDLDV